MKDPEARCAALASAQHGCITREQALGCGLSPESIARRVRAKRWRRVLPRTYVLRAAPATWEQRVMAATLWGGETAVASVRSAAALWGFPGFPRGPVEISHRAARQSRRGVVVHRVELGPADVGHVDGIPVTTAARTLSDVAGIAPGDRFDAAFHYCLHERLTTVDVLDELAERRSGPGFSGATQFQEALYNYADGPATASPLEARLARRLGRSRLPRAVRQHEVQVDGGRRYLDFAWPDQKVGVEVDGFRWHSSRTAWREDRRRLAALRRAGWTIIQVSREDIDAGFGDLVGELRNLLR